MNLDKIKEDVEKIKNRIKNKDIVIVYDYKNPEEDIKTLITYIDYLIRELETYRKNVHI